MDLIQRTESEIRAYVDGYNACFNSFFETLDSKKYPPDVAVTLKECVEYMELMKAAVNGVLESEPKSRIRPNTKLKPCPFCGDTVHIQYESDPKAYSIWHDHKECSLMGPLWIDGVCAKSLSEAYKEWNKRIGGEQ